MLRGLGYVIIALAVATLVAWFANNPGTVSFDWFGYRVETAIGVLAGVFAVILGVVLVTYRAWLFLRMAPRRFRRRLADARRRRGYRALTQGLVAVAAGDAIGAKRHADKVGALLDEPALTMLLAAQSAQMSGDDRAAGRFFRAMAEQPETKFLGLHGQLTQAVHSGDSDRALDLAGRAFTLRPGAEPVAAMLFRLQVEAGRWQDAEATVKQAVRHNHLEPREGDRRRAALLFERARLADDGGRTSEALRLARQAHDLAPGFTPAATLLAGLQGKAGNIAKAEAVIQECWVSAPHPQLFDVLDGLRPELGAAAKLVQAKRLAGFNRDHAESHIAVARAAIAAKAWREAREHLTAAIDGEAPPARLCRLMADLEEGEKGDPSAAHDWLRRATLADPDPDWVCGDCGHAAGDWKTVCPRCGGFHSHRWEAPERVSRLPPPANNEPPPANNEPPPANNEPPPEDDAPPVIVDD